MKKNVLRAAFVVALGLAAGFTAYSSQKDELALSDVLLENIEALASGETNPFCENGCVNTEPTGCYCYRLYETYAEYTGW
jgi:hypothetical protein